jgi:hypothetical protein
MHILIIIRKKEMVCTDFNCVKYLESHFQTIGKRYEGDHAEIIQKMKDAEINHEHELKLKDCKMQILNERHAKEMVLKDNEVLKWKIKFLEK